MWRHLIVTFAALTQIGASSASPLNTHTVTVQMVNKIPVGNAHVMLGVAVLGHHVGSIESGWLVKQAEPGFLHIDWIKSGDWDGLTRDVEGPRDVSAHQLDTVVRVIESLGFSPSAIRAWRVPAPVGHDGFNEGDKVLTIGEILVDLGPIDTARDALDRWWKLILKDGDDPLEKIPNTNVRYAQELFFQTDCDALETSVRDGALATANAAAAAFGSDQKATVTSPRYAAPSLGSFLCPQDRKPNFYSASGGPPIKINQWDLQQEVATTVTYTIAGLPAAAALRTAQDDLPTWMTQYAFEISEPYVATVGTADCTTVYHDSLLAALADSRKRAQVLAGVLHTRVGRLGAARVAQLPNDVTSCEKSTVDAAWLLEGVAIPDHALVSAGYNGQAHGTANPQAVSLRALLNTARAAIVDDPHVVSIFETEPSVTSWKDITASETLIVER